MVMTLLGSILLKPLHELTVHHCEMAVKNYEKPEVSKKTADCPICDLQAYLFTSEFKTFDFQQYTTFFQKSTYRINEGFYTKIFDKKRGRAPPEFLKFSV